MTDKIIAAAREAGIEHLLADGVIHEAEAAAFYALAYRQGLEDAAGICARFQERHMQPGECEAAIRNIMKENNHG